MPLELLKSLDLHFVDRVEDVFALSVSPGHRAVNLKRIPVKKPAKLKKKSKTPRTPLIRVGKGKLTSRNKLQMK